MSQVNDILRMIDRLAPTERQELEARLAERLDAEWRREADRARQEAKHRGIDQDAIDREVNGQRYGR